MSCKYTKRNKRTNTNKTFKKYDKKGGNKGSDSVESNAQVEVNDTSLTGENSNGAKLIQFVEGTANKIAGTIDPYVGPILEKASNALLGDMPDKPFSDAAPQITEELKKNTEFLKNAMNDPNVKEALQEFAKSLSGAIDIAAEIAKPVLNEIVEDTLEAVNEAGEKAAVGFVNTGLNLFKAGVAEVPVVGGMIDLGLAAAQAMNYTSAAVAPLIENSARSAAKAMEGITKASDAISSTENGLANSLTKLNGVLTNVRNKTETMTQTPSLTGGARKRARKRANKTMKRLYNTINKFTRKK